jgi:hypothetical protein
MDVLPSQKDAPTDIIDSDGRFLPLPNNTFCNQFSCDGGAGNQADIAFRGVGESDGFSSGAAIWVSNRAITPAA